MTDPDDNASKRLRTAGNRDEKIIEVAEEHASILKREIDQGGVRLETRVEHREDVLTATLHGSAVEIRRVPRGEVVETAPPIRKENGVTIIPVLEERAVLRTELVLVEEVHLIQTETEEKVDVPVTLRRQRVVETRLEPDDTASPNHDPGAHPAKEN
ncbi:YsnF/AvaK domain-containing protein [Paracoccus aerodenitrificans]|uniref:YsnF/AvaK domain-containing protein n=1 Tax=Paracoccus aerodenitrificans TaxID=3017781 RepID=UPI0022EFDFAF|nr:YsnF/AvaK domain-containing protein [Paracoccus aerodenitrificans]WBU62643.1 YsnF/AvaK domain-containing protein [Paracoccus aerodenitrificans]